MGKNKMKWVIRALMSENFLWKTYPIVNTHLLHNFDFFFLAIYQI